MMRRIVTIDDKCQGHGICYSVAPDLFEPDNEGFGVVKNVEVEAGTELDRQAQLAVPGCPERAIHVSDV